MDRGVDARRLAAARAAEAEARVARTAAQQAARVAARLAGGGTSASGGGGGGVSTIDTYLNPLQVAGGAAGAPMVVPRPKAHLLRLRANSTKHKTHCPTTHAPVPPPTPPFTDTLS